MAAAVDGPMPDNCNRCGVPMLPAHKITSWRACAVMSSLPFQTWTPVQRKWLERLAKQLTHELVIDQAFVNTAFANDGGAKQLDKLLGGQLDSVMRALAAGLWPRAA